MSDLKELVEAFIDADRDLTRELFNSEIQDLEISKWDDDDIKEAKKALYDAGVTLKHEAQHGGEGEGEDYWSVYSFTKGDEKVYVKFNGYYQSYNGSEFDQWFYVEPKQVLVTQYFPVK